jgi:hypothetical protein
MCRGSRRLLKKAGLPASYHVGVLATVIKELRFQIESDLKITVSDAALATPHLEALYQDDVEDICENADSNTLDQRSYTNISSGRQAAHMEDTDLVGASIGGTIHNVT